MNIIYYEWILLQFIQHLKNLAFKSSQKSHFQAIPNFHRWPVVLTWTMFVDLNYMLNGIVIEKTQWFSIRPRAQFNLAFRMK